MEQNDSDAKESITYGRKNYKSMVDKIIGNFPDIEFIKMDGFDAAVIGVDAQSERLIYSTKKFVALLVEQGMTNDEALDHFYCNYESAGLGPKGPIYCFDFFE